MRLRRVLMFGIVALLGVATVLLPAIASSETPPTISAYSYGETRYWQPPSAQVGEGGTVKFTNPYTEIHHGLEFTGGPATPTCNGLPKAATEIEGAPSWQAECSFSAPGTYTFVCTVHPIAMKGTVVVSAAGVTTTTTSTPTNTSTTTSTNQPSAQEPQAPGGAAPRLLAGAASSAVRVARSQHGRSVRGSVSLAQGAAGGTLKLELLATLGGKGVVVGRLSHPSLSAGRVSFAVALNARARSALRRRGSLALRLRIRLAGSGQRTLTLTRALTLHG